MRAINLTQNKLLATDLSVADTFLRSLIGLLDKQNLSSGEGLWIFPCQSIHTFGMRFPIDVLFLSRDGIVLHLIEHMKPFRISKHVKAAKGVLELPSHTIPATTTQLGDKVAIVRG